MPKDTKLQVNVKCPKCELKFFKANLLEDHLKLHEGKKAKQCPVCQKSFNSNYHFKTHMRTHSRVKPFCCPVKVCFIVFFWIKKYNLCFRNDITYFVKTLIASIVPTYLVIIIRFHGTHNKVVMSNNAAFSFVMI